MYNINVCLDTVGYELKPESSEIGQISNRIGKSVDELSCPSSYYNFVHNVGQCGHTFTPATFNNETRAEKNFEQMQLFVLDFDGGISHETIKSRSNQYNLPIMFSYKTLSSEDNKEKFRVVYMNDVPITDKRGAKILKSALMEIFPEADKHDSDISRMYFGGKKLLHYDPKLPTIDPESIFRSLSHYLYNKRKANHYKEHIKKFAKKHGIKLTKRGMLDISVNKTSTESDGKSNNGKILPSSFILLNRTDGKNFPNSFYQINLDDGVTNNNSVVEKRPSRTGYRSSSLMDIIGRCRLFQEFESGERWLNHNELFGISTNLIHVEKGDTSFMNILSKYPDYYDHPKQDKFKYYLKYNKETEYKPSDCNAFCPYKDTCNHARNILLTVKPRRGTMERVTNHIEAYHTIEEVQDDLMQKLVKAIRSDDKLWHTIKAQTAAGKTEAFLQLMESSELRFLVAVPTNKLKQDIKIRANEKGIDLLVTPSLDEIKDEMPDYIWNTICRYRDTGQHQKVHTFVWKMAKEENIECLQKYLKQQKKFDEHDGHTITTHRRLLNMGRKALAEYDVVIIDEDIILGSIASNQCEIPISLLRKIYKKAIKAQNKDPSYKMLEKKALKILHSKDTERLLELPSFEWDADSGGDDAKCKKEDFDGISALTDIPSFCLAEHFIYRRASEEDNLSEDSIVFLKPWQFNNIKYIMVSATVDKDICEYCFGKEKVKFYECKVARYIGELNQYPEKSMSRSCIDGNPGILNRIREWSGFEHMITFKKYGIGDMYFGNAIGCDYLKGQNIDVVGTPYQVEFVYKLLPFTLGLNVGEDAKMKTHLVTYNGYKFYFKTFDEEQDALRKFHFWMIESELEQAVGRARLLRKSCTVNLYSNFPLRQAVMKESQYEQSDAN